MSDRYGLRELLVATKNIFACKIYVLSLNPGFFFQVIVINITLKGIFDFKCQTFLDHGG